MSWVYLLIILVIAIGRQTQGFLLAFAYGYVYMGDDPSMAAKYEIDIAYPDL